MMSFDRSSLELGEGNFTLNRGLLFDVYVHGDHDGLKLDFVDFHSRVPQVSPFAMPSLSNFPRPSRIGQTEEHTISKSTNHSVKPPLVTLCFNSSCKLPSVQYLVTATKNRVSLRFQMEPHCRRRRLPRHRFGRQVQRRRLC